MEMVGRGSAFPLEPAGGPQGLWGGPSAIGPELRCRWSRVGRGGWGWDPCAGLGRFSLCTGYSGLGGGRAAGAALWGLGSETLQGGRSRQPGNLASRSPKWPLWVPNGIERSQGAVGTECKHVPPRAEKVRQKDPMFSQVKKALI